MIEGKQQTDLQAKRFLEGTAAKGTYESKHMCILEFITVRAIHKRKIWQKKGGVFFSPERTPKNKA